MSLATLYSKPGHLVRRLQQIAVGAFLAEVGDLNITPIQYATLRGVAECQGVDIRTLAEIVALDRSTLGGAVTRLTDRGLLKKATNAEDRRSKKLQLTAAGRKALNDVEPRVVNAQVRMLERIQETDREIFIGLLAKLVHLNNSLSRAPGSDGGGQNVQTSLYAKPGHLIRRLQQISDAIFAEIGAKFSITPVQYASLVAIGEYPGIDNTRLSYLVALDRATLGSVVERLELKGWILRLPSEIDRRAKFLQITASGRKLLVDMKGDIARAESRVTAPLSRQDKRVFMELLTLAVNLGNDFSRAPLRWVDLSEPQQA